MFAKSTFLGNALSKIKSVHEGSGPKEDEVMVPTPGAWSTEGGGETGEVPPADVAVEEEEIKEQLNLREKKRKKIDVQSRFGNDIFDAVIERDEEVGRSGVRKPE